MKPRKIRTNVLVVGGGPAGATAAGVLAESGKEIILLEKNRAYAKPCGGGLALSAFDEFGIPKTSIKKTVHNLHIISPKGNRVAIGLKENGLAMVERREFDETLRQKAEKQGAIILEGEFVRIGDDRKCSMEAIIAGEKVEMVSDYIIAADGVNSRVRASLGIKPLPALLTASAKVSGPDTEFCAFWFGASQAPYSYSWAFPTQGGLSVGTGTLEPRRINDCFQKFLERSGMMVSGQKQIYKIPVWTGELFNRHKILFAGDAAGQVLPLSYEGLYYAMKAGKLAARAVLEGKVHHYKKMWKGRFQKRFILLNTLKNYFLKDDASAEKMIALHQRPEIQEASLRLWLRDDNRRLNLLHYLKLFGKFLR